MRACSSIRRAALVKTQQVAADFQRHLLARFGQIGLTGLGLVAPLCFQQLVFLPMHQRYVDTQQGIHGRVVAVGQQKAGFLTQIQGVDTGIDLRPAGTAGHVDLQRIGLATQGEPAQIGPLRQGPRGVIGRG